MLLSLQKLNQKKFKYERGLSMVPMLIHLPPPSEDTELNGRDVRDLVDENISKAQIIYNIIASTIEQSFKNRFHGQRHFCFEIVGIKGFVRLYTAVPADYVSVMQQAIVSAYPAARLEITPEYNIFSQVGGMNAVMGGQLNLKEKYAYPIATYQDLKRDAFQSILNALSTVENEDGAAIQLLFRPAETSWRKTATDFASAKKKGTDKGLTVGSFAKDMMTAFVKPPEPKEERDKPKDISSLEQSIIDAIEDKTRHPGFEVAIRIVASSNVSQRSQAILNNIIASFSLFDAPGRNGFDYHSAHDPSELVTNFLLRAFPMHKKKNILNSVELATIFHFPDQRSIPTSQLERQDSKQVDGPRNMPQEGLLLGFNVFRGVKKPVRLGLGDRQRHMYVVGQTGTGKSTFLENLALQDMLRGDGFAFVDPHGDTAEKLLSMVPKERAEDVIYFCPSDMTYPMGLNLFEFHNADQKDFIIQEVIGMLYKLYDPQHQGIMGPRYESIFRNCALAVMADPAGSSFVDIPKLFRDPEYLKHKLTYVKDPNVLDYWQKEYPASQRSNDSGEVISWFVSKFGAFLSNEMMRNIIGQTKSAFDLRDVMDNKKILLVNLSKGRTGELNSKLLGMVFIMKFQAAAMSRSDVPENERTDFALYVDEFQNFSTDSFATIMSEARKYHLNLIVANQFTTQLTEEIRDAVFGNIGTIVAFRIGQNDVESLGRYFQPHFDGDDLLRVPNANTIVRTLINGVPTQPFSMATLPPLGNPNPGLSDALKQLSAAKFGKPRAVVEKAIFERLATRTPEPTPFSNPFSAQAPVGGQPAALTPPAVTPAPSSGSFLDEWLSKQKAMPASARPTAQPSSATMPSATPLPPQSQIATDVASVELDVGTQESVTQQEIKPLTTEPTTDLYEAGNVSSAELDEQEVKGIAAELKKGLNSEQAAQGTTQVTPQVPTDGQLLSLKSAESQALANGDTIAIDNDGTIHLNNSSAED
ncbi:ATP-binding protein [Candidatus Saccharibacteria bacterium]|nr:MAG: ATP-binding protein [Candidatus Saccharibacteria bacterium]